MIVRSIRMRLLLMLLLSMLLLWITILCFTWMRTGSEINRVYDAELALVAQLLAVATEHESKEFDLDEYQTDLSESGYTFPLLFQVWSHENRLMVRGPGAPETPLASTASNGYSDSEFNGSGWRVYTLSLPDSESHHEYRVQVARSHADVQRLARNFVVDVITPLLLIVPLLGILWFIVNSGLKPVRELAQLIAERDYDHLNPVPVEHVPEELTGLVDELNALLERLQGSIERNSRFTADVAHELRTPIAGMLVTLQSSAAGRTDEERERCIQQFKRGLLQLNHVINQLLILAFIEPEKVRSNFNTLDLEEIAQDVLADISPMALDKQIELELECIGKVFIDGNRELIGVMLKNLVSNAIKFTPNEGEVAVRVANTEGGASITIEDAGPGIPDDKKKWVFERLNRLAGETESGSGLGLSIVQEICELHRGRIFLSDREEGPGLIVNLFLPSLRKA